MSGIGPYDESQMPEFSDQKRLRPEEEEEASYESTGTTRRVKKAKEEQEIPSPARVTGQSSVAPQKTRNLKRSRGDEEQETVKADKTATKILNPGKTLSPESQYEAHIDDFIIKLIDVGYNGDPKKLKHAIMDRNTLDLGNQPLSTLPPEIGNLTNLGLLRLSGSPLTTLPPEIGNLTNLIALHLEGTPLTTLPPEFGNLTNLQLLWLCGTPLTSLPPEIGNLTNLKTLDLADTLLTSSPPELGNLTNLRTLLLYRTPLTTLPPEFGNLTNLQSLDLDDTPLTSLPITFRNLRSLVELHLEGTPIAARGDESSLGRQELRAHFGDRCVFTEHIEQMPSTTTENEVYQALDRQEVRINRTKLAAATVPELPGKVIEDGHDFIERFLQIVSKLEYDNEDAPGYVSYASLAGDFAGHGQEGDNWSKIDHNVLPRLTGYFRTLYDLPLEPGEVGGWQMYEEHKPALKKALSYIVTQMVELEDKSQLVAPFIQFVDSFLHCPTGQKEGIDTICLGLLENKTTLSTNLAELVSDIIARKKNTFFKTAILTKGVTNSQNVHLISTYEQRLKETLGLSNILQYEERIGVMGKDPFNNNSANVLKVFYDLVTPDRMVDWLLEKTISRYDLAERERLTSPQLAADKRAELKAKDKANKQFKPITFKVVYDYLSENNLIDTTNEDWWKPYFSSDPILNPTASLTHQGAKTLLTHLGYIAL